MSGNEKALFASGSDAALEALLSQTRAQEPEISEALTARILAEAARVSAERAALRRPAPSRAGAKTGFGGALGYWLRALGGLPAAAAFCAALGLGVATGAAAPRWTGAETLGETEALVAALEADSQGAALLNAEILSLLAAENPLEGS